MGSGHRLDTEARGYPAADGTRTLVTQPWTSNRTKVRRERKAHQDMMNRAGLTADIVYIAKPVVTGSAPRLKRTGAPVKTYIDPTRMIRSLAPTNGGNPDA